MAARLAAMPRFSIDWLMSLMLGEKTKVLFCPMQRLWWWWRAALFLLWVRVL